MKISSYGIMHSILAVLTSFLFFNAHAGYASANDDVIAKRLMCYYYDRNHPLEGMGIRQPGLPYVWAKGYDQDYIYVTGKMVDGFFIAQTIQGKGRSGLGLRRIGYYENKYSVAISLCENALKLAFPTSYQDKILVHHAVKNTYMSLHQFPVVFKEQDNQHLNKIDRMVVFGDSLSDQGNVKTWLRIFPKEPYFAGRFSNQEIWVDYVQRMTGIAVQNWAYAGSVANPEKNPYLKSSRLRDRVMSHVQTRASGNIDREIERYLHKSLGGESIVNGDATLFTLWIGANDYLPFIESNEYADSFLDHPRLATFGSNAVVEQVTDLIVNYVERLHALGARHIFVANLPDLGKAPRMLKNHSYHRSTDESHDSRMYSLSTKVSKVIEHHNTVLRRKLAIVEAKHENLHLIFGDAAETEKLIFTSVSFEANHSFFNYDFSRDFVKQFFHRGQSVAISKQCYRGGTIRRQGTICSEPKRASFWDDLHPTTYGHCLIAAYFHKMTAAAGLIMPTPTTSYLQQCRPDVI